MTDVNEASKIAIGMVVMCFIVALGLTVMLIARSFWMNTANQVDKTASNVGYADMYSLASMSEPVPVASIFRVMQNVNMMNDTTGNGLDFHLIKPNGQEIVGAVPTDLKDYMSGRAYFSYYDGYNPDTLKELGGTLWVRINLV